MKRRFDEYTRLARGVFGVSSLWLGPKDVLYVRGTGVVLGITEEYVRFELSRIQSLAVIPTTTGRVLNGVYGGVAVTAGMAAGALVLKAIDSVGRMEAVYAVLSVPLIALALVATALLVTNMVLGPTCRFQIQTATRIERVRPVRRLRTAERVLTSLTAAVTVEQSGRADSVAGDPAAVAPAPVRAGIS